MNNKLVVWNKTNKTMSEQMTILELSKIDISNCEVLLVDDFSKTREGDIVEHVVSTLHLDIDNKIKDKDIGVVKFINGAFGVQWTKRDKININNGSFEHFCSFNYLKTPPYKVIGNVFENIDIINEFSSLVHYNNINKEETIIDQEWIDNHFDWAVYLENIKPKHTPYDTIMKELNK